MTQQPPIFDRLLLRNRRHRIIGKLDNYGFLRELAVKNIIDRLDDMERKFERGLDIGSCGLLTKHLPSDKINTLIHMDLSEQILHKEQGLRIAADEEQFPFKPQSFDIIISNLCFHWVNQCQQVLHHIRQLLTPNGVFIANFFGPETLKELRSILSESETSKRNGMALRISPTIDVKTAGMLLQQVGFDLPITDSEIITLTHEDIEHLHEDLKAMAENATFIKKSPPLNKAIIKEANTRYKEHHSSEEGDICSTFEVITMTGLATQNI